MGVTRVRSGADRLLVTRQRLLDRLDGIGGGGVGVVVAPAGSGKSVLLEQWVACRRAADRPPAVAHVRIDPRSRDQVVLARQLVAAVAGEVPGFGEQLAGLASVASGRLGVAFVQHLLAELSDLDRDVDVVVDDAHLLAELPEMVLDAATLLAGLPPNVRVVLGARWDPDVGLHRLRVERRLVEVRAADLAFDLDEAGELVASFPGLDLGPADVEALRHRTDGWVVGLQLACVSLAGASDPAAFVADLRGSDLLVAEYLTREVLEGLAPPERAFLLRSSILPWVSVELCAAVEDAPSLEQAQQRIADVVARDLFLDPVDGHGHRFRFHQLFAELLAYQLRLEDPTSEAEVRRRAAVWLESNGHVADAADQLVALGDVAGVLALVRRHGSAFFARSEAVTVLGWLDAVAATAEPTPELLVDLLAAQTAAHETPRALETYRQLRHRDDVTLGQRAAAEALYSCSGLDDLATDEVERAAHRAEELGAECRSSGEVVTDFLGIGGPASAEAMASYMLAVVHLHRGELEATAAQLERTLHLEGMGYALWKAQTLATLALVRALSGRLDDALVDGQAALDVARTLGSHHHHAVTHAHVAMAVVGLDRLDLVSAAEQVELAGVCADRSGWAVDRALHRLLAARLALVAQGPGEADDALALDVPPVTLPAMVHGATAVTRARLHLAEGDLRRAGEVLAPCPSWPERPAAVVDVALAGGDLAAVRSQLESWQPSDRRGRVGRAVRVAVACAAEGRSAEAGDLLLAALDQAEEQQLRAVFLEVPGALGLLRSQPRAAASPFARSVLDAGAAAARRAGRAAQLVEPLTGRELDLLPYLPSRLTNAEMAAQLYVSVNTIKTHLQRIYRKLGVEDRDAAVARATELGLL